MKSTIKSFLLLKKKQTKQKIKLFIEEPDHPSLRTKKIQGADIWEFSVNVNIRILWFYEGEELIVLLDIGHHDSLNKF